MSGNSGAGGRPRARSSAAYRPPRRGGLIVANHCPTMLLPRSRLRSDVESCTFAYLRGGLNEPSAAASPPALAITPRARRRLVPMSRYSVHCARTLGRAIGLTYCVAVMRRQSPSWPVTIKGDHMSSEVSPSASGQLPPDSALEKRTLRKVLIRLIPFIIAMYFINYLDRTNLGIAEPGVMNEDLAMSAIQFGFAAGIFFFAYLILEVTSNLALHKFGARIWLALILISWGIVAAAMAFVPNHGW